MADPAFSFLDIADVEPLTIVDVGTLRRFGREHLPKLVALLHDQYGSIDLCAHILVEMRSWGMDVQMDAYFKRCTARV